MLQLVEETPASGAAKTYGMPEPDPILDDSLLVQTNPHNVGSKRKRLMFVSVIIGVSIAVLLKSPLCPQQATVQQVSKPTRISHFMWHPVHTGRTDLSRLQRFRAAVAQARLRSSLQASASLVPPRSQPSSQVEAEVAGPHIECRPDQYEDELAAKVARVRSLFKDCAIPNETYVARSATTRFRMRAEFRVWKANSEQIAAGMAPLSYIMFKPGSKQRVHLNGTAHDSALFPMGSKKLNELMVKVLEEVDPSDVLRTKLIQVDFYTAVTGHALVALIYHKKLDRDGEWGKAAESLKAKLGCELIGRSRGQKLVLGNDWIIETMDVDGISLTFKQHDNAFAQPNTGVACKMASWARAAAVEGEVGMANPPVREDDLVEMYCGAGMFSIALAPLFRNVVATEISRAMTATAIENAARNNVTNIMFGRLSAEEFSEALAGTATFKRLGAIQDGLKKMTIRTVLVDPPRAGMGDEVSKILSQFDRIIYISCDPTTCRRDYMVLQDTHYIARFAVFDQFPYTPHVEMGMLLKRREVVKQ